MSEVRKRLGLLVRQPQLRRRTTLALLVFALSFVPMAGTLGYFSGLLLAPVLSLLAASGGVDAVVALRSQLREEPEGTEARGHWGLVVEGARRMAWITGLPLGILLIAQLWNVNCDPLGGAAYFAMGPVASALIGWSCGVAAAIVLGDRRRVLLLLAAWSPFVLSMIIALRRLYFDPVVFAFDPFWGWFSGPIYDEGISIGSRYFLYRAYNLAGVVSIWLAIAACTDQELAFSWRRGLADGPRRLRLAVALVLALGCAAIGFRADRLGFTATTESLAEVLSATRETEHFVIRYSPTSTTAREIDMIAAEHEFAWDRLEQRLGSAPERKVQSFLFDNGKQRRRLLGADKVEVSPPWRQQMYLSHRAWPHDVLHHELAHAFLGDFGDRLLGLPISGGRINGALVEGVPTALAPRPLDNLGIHEQAAVLDRLDKRPPLAQIMGAGFWGAAASRAYTASGSFVAWLAQEHGWPSVAGLYANAGDFEASYGEDLAALEGQWLTFIRALPLDERDVEAAAQRFERGSVFRRPCAHRAAELAREAALARLRDQRDEALEIQRTLCSIEPEQATHVLRLADMLASWGEFEEAAEALDELAQREGLTSSVRAVIEEQRGDTQLVAGALLPAAAHYRQAMTFGSSEARTRQLQIKLDSTADPDLAPLVADYFDPFSSEAAGTAATKSMLRLWTATQISRSPGHASLGNYLLGRQLLFVAAPEQALDVLELALSPVGSEPPLESPEIIRAARWSLIRAATQMRRWQLARAQLDAVEAMARGDGHRASVAEWRDRLDFFEGYFATE